jgi:hypothetical protein
MIHSPGTRKQRHRELQPSAIARQAIENQVPPRFFTKLACNTEVEAELVEFERGVSAYVSIQTMCFAGAPSLEHEIRINRPR